MAIAGISRADLLKARGDTDFIADARAALVIDSHPLAGLSLGFLLVVLGAGYVWADRASLDEVTIGHGSVIPSSREQIIQSLEGGILSELLVREGDVVEAGDVLLRIDDTRFIATYREGQSRQRALIASITRLRAEAEGGTLEFPAQLSEALVQIETKLHRARSNTLRQAVAALSRSQRLAQDELEMTEPLVEKGIVSQVEALRLRREINDLQAQVQERRNAFRARAGEELAAKEAELAALGELDEARADQVRRAVVRAPMRGTIKNVRINTVGGVIQPGRDIMEIVPLEDRLLVEARIRPSDVAFLRPGLPATVKITAYDYSVYGGLEGELEYISADTIVEERGDGEAFYRVRVRTAQSHLQGKHGPLPIIAGMTATVEVLTGHKTVLEYILKPFIKTRDSALRER